MSEGRFTIIQNRNLSIFLFSLMLISALFLACGSSGPSISEAPEEAPEDTTEAFEVNQEEELERKRKQMEEAYKEELEERYQGRANTITTFYTNAQRLFYMQNYQAALYHINKAAEIRETSDILALRGSIYLALGSKEQFVENWRMAFEMDENVPIPNVAFVINELKAQGMINENYKPGN